MSSIQGRKAKQIELREKEEEALEDLRRKEGNLARALGGLIARREVSDLPHAVPTPLPHAFRHTNAMSARGKQQ